MVITMKAKDIMTKNIIVSDTNTDIFTLAKIMKTYNIGFIPIEKDKKIIGVITDRDIVVDIIANKDLNNKIESYINKDIVYCDIFDNVDTVLDKMKNYKIKRILVKNNNKLVGIISLSDILNYYNNDKTIMETIKTIYKIDTNNYNEKTFEIDEFYL